MTLILIALYIAGHSFEWYWILGAFVFDIIWTAIKLNFLAILMRRAVEETVLAILEETTAAADAAASPAPEVK